MLKNILSAFVLLLILSINFSAFAQNSTYVLQDDYMKNLQSNPDSLALVALYNSTNGANWTDNTNWLTSNPISTWEGVTFDSITDRVTGLNLSGNNLVGTIPPEIGNLTSLTDLNLSYNDISGTIPTEFWNLVNLSWLDFDNCNLSGEIPPEIQNLNYLNYLGLQENDFTGTIPEEIGNLYFLETAWLQSNNFSGTVPSSISNLYYLQLLSLSNNLLDSLPDFSFSQFYLSELKIDNNFFTFNDIVPNLNIADSVRYAPQNPIFIGESATINVGDNLILSVPPDYEGSQYQWYKTGFPIPNANYNPYEIISAALSDSGLYHCEITNLNVEGLTLYTFPINVTVMKPSSSITYTEPIAGQDLVFTVSAEREPSYLYYRPIGKYDFSQISFVYQEMDSTYQATIPGSEVTLRGLEYEIYFHDQTFEYGIIQVQVANASPDYSLDPQKYRMISIPLEDLESLSMKNIFGTGNDGKNWRLHRWAGSGYREYFDSDAPFRPGDGFWLITRDGGSFDVESGLSVMPINGGYTIQLHSGWNQIGNPFAFPVDWRYWDIPLYSWNGLEYEVLYDYSTLEPWIGYFAYADSAMTITIWAEENFEQRKTRGNSILTESDYSLRLSASLSEKNLIDTQNYLGFRNDASDERDWFDFYEPPPIGEHIRLSIVEQKDNFMTNFKPLSNDGQTWDLAIDGTQSNLPIKVELTETGQLPKNFQIYLLDLDYQTIIPIENNAFQVNLNSKFPERHLKIILGTKKFAEENSDGISLVPLKYVLDQNYPNPFNPETTIRYQLSRREHTELAVYNIAGQKVRTIIDEPQDVGYHSVIWNGKDERGKSVPSGVYIYTLRAGNFSDSRKLVLIR